MKTSKLIPKVVRLKELIDRPLFQFGILPLVFLVGPSLAVTYYSVELFRSATKEILPIPVTNFFDSHVVLVLLLSLVISYVISNLHLLLEKVTTNGDSLTYEGLLHLKEALEKIVQFKADRFETESNGLLSNSSTPEAIFKAITKPDQQIAHIAYALHGFLEAITEDIEFKVRIIQADNRGKPIAWYTYAPSNLPPNTEISVLQHHDSSVSTCLRNKKIFIVENIKEAANKSGGREYVMSHSDPEDEVGSLICYPIFQKQIKCYPLVLAVSANKPYFKRSKKLIYKWILDQFVLRIQLEYSLVLLKENCQNA
ncbi:MAG: hypothetical protein U1C96_07250 [Gallionella sp.]|nr:hypothetical protein [Gallionella sp.]